MCVLVCVVRFLISSRLAYLQLQYNEQRVGLRCYFVTFVL